ncbi:hypothetical protein CV102_25455 [Natronococcus pandeyae]|uniref:Uncharacterized protein n=1 Tax=Natronococcus pandeyae TaxID=2055836 RepID=A0A8J8PWT4_9EURY|nr:hypothetical protein CV102_25455 [Natronococcus pandeyae]
MQNDTRDTPGVGRGEDRHESCGQYRRVPRGATAVHVENRVGSNRAVDVLVLEATLDTATAIFISRHDTDDCGASVIHAG